MPGKLYTDIAEKRKLLREIYGGMMTLTDVARELGRNRSVARAWVRELGLGTQIGKRVYWSKQKMMNHADAYSPAYSAAAHKKLMTGEIPENDMWKFSSFWYKNFDDMAKKTMLRQLISRWGVMSTELQQAFVQDTNFAAIGDGNEIVTTPEELQQFTQPEAIAAVEQIDLSDT